MNQSATFSYCRKYRYSLWRQWNGLFLSGYAMFIGLNPMADETTDDPTIRRCIRYAKKWGYGSLCMTNLFAFQATLPEDMKIAEDPVGPDNDKTLVQIAEDAEIIIAAWGKHGSYLGRDKVVRALFPQLHFLKLTRDGFPGHPLYLPKKLKPTLWGKRWR